MLELCIELQRYGELPLKNDDFVLKNGRLFCDLRGQNFDQFRAALEGELGKKGRDEWMEIMLEAGIPVSQINTLDEALVDEQLHYRKMLVSTANHGREYTVVGNPVKISGFEDSNYRPKIPELDEHKARL